MLGCILSLVPLEIVVAAGQADLDARDFADQPVADDLGRLVESCLTERCHEPVCQMRLFFCTAFTMACCSAMVRASGFSP